MNCPRCGTDNTKVIDTRTAEDGNAIRRRRVCLDCDERFSTLERIEGLQPQVIKKDGVRQLFSSEKLLTSLSVACSKRPVSNAQLLSICNDVERLISSRSSHEIKTTEIGEIVMERLRKLDKVAYVRFASVYKDFTNPSLFAEEVINIKEDT